MFIILNILLNYSNFARNLNKEKNLKILVKRNIKSICIKLNIKLI